VTKDNPWAAVYVDLVNTFYGRGQIPVGMVKGSGVTPENSKMIQAPAERRGGGGGGGAAAAVAGSGPGRHCRHRAGGVQHESGALAGCAGGCGTGQAEGQAAERDGGEFRAVQA